MASQPKTFYTPEQYLELEAQAAHKSEYVRGEIFAMSGGSSAHSLLAARAGALVGGQLLDRDCLLYQSDMRVHIPATTLYTYPDLSVVCGEPRYVEGQTDTLLNPILIIEILSPSTEAYDRGEKFAAYRGLESLREYVLISSQRVAVDVYTRQMDGRWLLTSAENLDAVLSLESVGAQLGLRDLYKRIALNPSPRTTPA